MTSSGYNDRKVNKDMHSTCELAATRNTAQRSWFCQLHSLKVVTGEKEPRPGAWTHSLRPNAELQPCKPPMWPWFFVPNRHIYTVMGGLQCCNHLEPMPWGTVRWYAQQAASNEQQCIELRNGAPSSTSGSRAHAHTHASCPLSIPSHRSSRHGF